jgi:phosphoribosylformylglycinamidine synthase I
MKDVKVLVLTGYGLNCDLETAYAFEHAGAIAHRVHINRLVAHEIPLDEFQIIVFGGGFSWGDDHGAGVLHAVRFRTHIGENLFRFIDQGNLVLGICNGFQTLVNLGLLPGIGGDYTTRSVALTYNDCGNFRDDWVTLRLNDKSPCVFTRGMDIAEMPVRHGEGKFYTEEKTLKTLIQNQQVVAQYADRAGNLADGKFPENPNGSVLDIAGICDETGRVFGLMPHPEAYNHYTNHPDWTREKELRKRKGEAVDKGPTPGIRMFQNAVEYLRSRS